MTHFEKYEMYKLIHLFGIFMTFVVLGGLGLHVLNGGNKETNANRKVVAALHGTGVFLILLGGFGTLAYVYKIAGSKQMSNGLELWVILKLGIWLFLALGLTFFYRLPKLGVFLFFGLPLLGLMAGYFAIKKPTFDAPTKAATSQQPSQATRGGGSGGGSDSRSESGASEQREVESSTAYRSSANDLNMNKGCSCSGN